MATCEDLVQKLDELPDTFALFSNRKNPPTEDQIAAFEAKTGRPFGTEHKKLLQRFGAFALQVKEEVWPRPEEYDVLPAWRFWFGFEVLGLGELPPVLSMASALADHDQIPKGARPFLRRIGAGFLALESEAGVGRWTPKDNDFEPAEGDVIDLILEEIALLEESLERLQQEQATVAELLARGEPDGFAGPEGYDLANALEGKPGPELAQELPRLVAAMMKEHSLKTLSIIEKAGQEVYPSVAEQVYHLFDTGGPVDRQYAVDCMGKLKDVSERALGIYARALADEDEDVLSYALDAIREVAENDGIRAFAPQVEQAFHNRDFDDEEVKTKALGTLGLLGRDIGEPVARVLERGLDDLGFLDLVNVLEGVSLEPHCKDALLRRYRGLDADCSVGLHLNIIAALVQIGVEDRESMADFLKSKLLPRGGRGAQRAQAILDRWN